jgi:hemerythrin-like domain-containing protein
MTGNLISAADLATLRRGVDPADFSNPLDAIVAAHAQQLVLCDLLERIADDLPFNADAEVAAVVRAYLQTEMQFHVRDEEEGLFPLLRQYPGEDSSFGESLDQFSTEHRSDARFCEEVVEILDVIVHGDELENPDMAGYLLRGFFETQRRHIKWENKLVLPQARKCLSEQDLDRLRKVMTESRQADR